jgi:tetratricopeptide (TPR) repeat protein
VIFSQVTSELKDKEGIVGTTKLTRKEIMAEDPVHGTIVQAIEYLKNNGRMVGFVVVAVILLSIGIYGGRQILKSKEQTAQEQLGKGMKFFHAQVAPDATNDPYSKGPNPVFKSETDKYQAAAKEFSSLASGYGNSSSKILARYYLGLTQIQLGQRKEATQNLESVIGNSNIGYFAKKVLAANEADSKNYKRAMEILEGMIKDPQCTLPKEDLSIELSRILVAQGKKADAIKILSEAVGNSQGASFSRLKQQAAEELDKIQKGPKATVQP